MKNKLYRLYIAYLKAKGITQSELSFEQYKDICQLQRNFLGIK